jgi:hypothetical protein
MILTHLAFFFFDGAGAGTTPEPEVVQDVIRNFRRDRRGDDDAYSWLREARKEEVEQEVELERKAVAVVAVELEERIQHANDETAELSARLQLEMAREHYLSTFEEAYREDMREALIEQWREEVAYQRYIAHVRRRAALLLLMAH